MREVDRTEVHITHCCQKCGCKYFDPDCPVELGLAPPEFPCEDCERIKEEMELHFSTMNLRELRETVEMLQKEFEKRGTEP